MSSVAAEETVPAPTLSPSQLACWAASPEEEPQTWETAFAELLEKRGFLPDLQAKEPFFSAHIWLIPKGDKRDVLTALHQGSELAFSGGKVAYHLGALVESGDAELLQSALDLIKAGVELEQGKFGRVFVYLPLTHDIALEAAQRFMLPGWSQALHLELGLDHSLVRGFLHKPDSHWQASGLTFGMLLDELVHLIWQGGQITLNTQPRPLPEDGLGPLTVSGVLNVEAFVVEGPAGKPRFDYPGLSQAAQLAVRFLDNQLDAQDYPNTQTQEEALQERNLALSVTGLAPALEKLGLRYHSEESVAFAEKIMMHVQREANRASEDLANIRGAFRLFDRRKKGRARRNKQVLGSVPGQLATAPGQGLLPVAGADPVSPLHALKLQGAICKVADGPLYHPVTLAPYVREKDVYHVVKEALSLGLPVISVNREGSQSEISGGREKEKDSLGKDQAASWEDPKGTPRMSPGLHLLEETTRGKLHVFVSVDPMTEREQSVFAQLEGASTSESQTLTGFCRLVTRLLQKGEPLADLLVDLEETAGFTLLDGLVAHHPSEGVALALAKYLESKEETPVREIWSGAS